jgi:glycosyltransferase involved in cell wall biosynthesis
MPEQEHTHPLVTVITPTYNRAGDYLAETIESVLAQDYPHFEYIVLDDGSTDHTPQLLEEYGDRIIRERHANMGVIRTVNKGFRMARGEFITVANSDDPALPGWLSAMIAHLQHHPEALAAYPDWLMIDENSQPLRPIQAYDYSYADMLRWHHCLPGPGTVLRRRALELEPGYDPDFPYTFDFAYYLRLGLRGSMMRVPQVLATYRSHTGTITQSQASEQTVREHIRILDDLYARPEMPAEGQRVRAEAYSAAYYIAGTQCLENRSLAGGYFLRSIVLRPVRSFPNGPNGRRRSWYLMLTIMLSALLPRTLRRPLGALKQTLERRLRGAR